MALAAFIDLETYSAVNLKKAGADAYFEHPSTGIWCLCYTYDKDEEIYSWQPGQPIPHFLAKHILEDGIVVIHNAHFELLAWQHKMEAYGWPAMKPEQTECTMARAAALALPQELGMLCRALHLPDVKDKEGHGLMMRMCRPRRVEEDGSYVWWNEPEKIEKLIELRCKPDVRAEREVYRRLHPLSKAERKVWALDYKINRRGVMLDVENIQLAEKLVGDASEEANVELQVKTNYFAHSTKQVAALMQWFDAAGVNLPDLKKRSVVDALKRKDLGEVARRVLELRQLASKASTAKLKAMLASVSKDNRARGWSRYHAASTGRFGSVRWQAHNLPRPQFLAPGAAEVVIEQFSKGAEAVEFFGGPVQAAIASCLRSLIVAAPGHDLIGGDYSNIEGRVCAWLASEDWKLDAFRAYDAGKGPDLYHIGASKILGLRPDNISPEQRQAYGKVPELALQYNGGLGAFTSMGLNYNVTVVPGDKDDLENYVLSETTVRRIVKAWREQHPAIVSMWGELFEAACSAIRKPEREFKACNGKITYKKSGPFLWCILPNGKTINYVRPRLERATGDDAWKGLQIAFEGIDPITKQWGKQFAYGGLLAENNTQAVARECLVEGMQNEEDAGYPVVLDVHDDIVSEVPEGFGTTEEFTRLMLEMRPWARGLPLAVKAWRQKRYGLK